MNRTAPTASHRLQVRTVVVRLSRKLRATYRIRTGRLFSALLAALVSICSPLAHALPEAATVSAGHATVTTPTANTMVVNQTTPKAVLDWLRFNIGKGETVRFDQPDAASVALNRVSGGASTIAGALQANGQVFLVNPAGVLFAPGAQVNVGGLVATTLDLSNSDFVAGRYQFSGSSAGGLGSIANEGSLAGRYVVLAGPSVSNSGTIDAQRGAVGLLAGSRVTVDPAGAGLVKFSVDAGAVNSAIANSGTIMADGGKVALLASSLSDTLPTVINQSGVIRANTIAEQGGIIVLSGGAHGAVSVSGTLEARGDHAGEAGGTVKVLGDKVALRSTSQISASGDAGGGTVLVGGNWQGKGTEQNATSSVMSTGAQIRADAVTRGDGGTVAVWADGSTAVGGAISTRGGAQGGNGGKVETSGKESLVVAKTTTVDTSAPQGSTGNWLLDPKNIIVAIGGVAALTDVDQFADVSAADVTIDPATINPSATTVTLQANNDIAFIDPIAMTQAGAGLSVRAGRSITVFSSISTTNGGINMVANDAGADPMSRDGGLGRLTINPGGSLSAGTGGVSLYVLDGAGVGTGGSIDVFGAINSSSLILQSSQGGIDLGATVTASGTTSLYAGQDIVQSGGSLSSSALQVFATNGTAVLGQPANAIGSLRSSTTAAGFTLVDGSGGLFVSGSGGGIRGGTGLASITTSGGDLYVTSNESVTGANVTLVSSDGAVNINPTTTTAGTLTVNAGTSISAGTVNAGTLTGSAGTTATFINGSNAVGNLGAFNTGSGFSLVDSGGGLHVNGAVTGGTGLASVRTSGGVLDVNAAVSGSNVTLASTNSAVSLDGAVTTPGTLTLNANGSISQTVALSAGTVAGSAGTGSVTLANAGNAVGTLNAFTAGAGFTLVDGAGGLNVNGAVGGAGGPASITTSGGVLAVNNSVTGSSVSLAALGGGVVQLGGNVIAGSGNVDIDGSVSLSNSVVISAGAGDGVTLDDVAGNGNNLTLAAAGGASGGTISGVNVLTTAVGTALGATSVSASSASLGGNVTTGGSQQYSGAVTLNDSATLSTSSGNITTGNVAGGANSFSANAAGNLTTGTITANNLTLTSGGLVTTSTLNVAGDYSVTGQDFSGSLSPIFGGAGSNFTIIDTAGGLTLGAISAPGTLSISTTNGGSLTIGSATSTSENVTLGATGGGTVSLGGNVSAAGGSVTFNGPLLLTGGSVVTAGTIATFNGTVNGNQALTVNAAGVTTFGSTVGASTALASLTTNAAGTTVLNGNVTTTGSQTYNDNVTLNGNTMLQTTASGNVGMANVAAGANDLTVSAGGSITTGAVTADDLSLAATTTVSTGVLTLSGNYSVVAQDFLGSSLAPTFDDSGNNFSIGDSAGGLTVGTLSAPGNLVVTTANGGNLSIAGAAANAGVVNLTANGGGTILLSGNVSAGSGVNISGPLWLGNTVAIGAGAGSITLGAVTGNGNDLSLTGDTSAGAISGANALTTSVGTDIGATSVSATSAILGGNVITSGSQQYGGSVVLTSNVVLSSSASAIDTGNVTGGANTFTVSAFGSVATGSVSAAGVTLTSSNSSILLAGAVTTPGTLALSSAGSVTQTAALSAGTLTGSVGTTATLTNAGNAIGTLGAFSTGSGFSLVDSSGGLTVAGNVSGGSGTTSITTTGGSLITSGTVTGANVTLASTSGDIALNGAVTTVGTLALNAATNMGQGFAPLTAGTLTGLATTGSAWLSNAGNAVTTLGTFTTGGSFQLVDASGGLTVVGAVSSGSGSVNIATAGGPLALGASNVSSAGTNIVLSGAGVTQAAGGTVNGGAGEVMIDGNDGAISLAGAINTTSNSGAAVQIIDGATAVLGNITTGAGGWLNLGVSGANNLSGAVTQNAGTVVNAGGVSVSGGSTVNLGNANAVATLGTVNTTGGFTFNDASGGLNVNGSVSGGTGAASITTAGALAVNNGITGADVTLASTGGGIALDGAVATAGTLTLNASGSITQTAALGAGTLTGSAGNTRGATLGHAGNAVDVLNNFTAGNGLTLVDGAGDLTLSGSVLGGASPMTISTAGTLTITGVVASTGVNVTGTGITQAAGSTINGGFSDVRVDANDGPVNMAGTITTGSSSATAVQILDAATVALGNIFTANTGTVRLGTAGADSLNGAVTQNPGAAINTGTLTIAAAGSVTLGNANTTANLGPILSDGGFVFNDTTGGLAISGVIDASGPVSIATAGTLAVNNAVGGTGVTLAAGSDIALGADVAAGTGTAALSAAGSIGRTAGTVSGNAASLAASSGSIGADVAVGTLTGTAGTSAAITGDAATLAGFTTGTGFGMTNAGNLTVTAAISGGTGAVTLAANGGTLMQKAAGDITAGGTVNLTGSSGIATAGDVTTTNAAVNYHGATTLTGAVAVSTGNGAVGFGTVTGDGNDLSLSSTGGVTAGAISGVNVLTTGVGTDLGAASVAFNGATLGGNVKTTGAQTYGGAVTLVAGVTAESTGNADIAFNGSIDGAQALTVTTGGLTTFAGSVGGTTPLASVLTNGGGTTVVAGNVTTAGAQTFEELALGGNAALRSTGNQAITLANVMGGGNDLALASTGGVTAGALAGLGGLTLSAGTDLAATSVATAGASLAGNVTTTGSQRYAGPLQTAAGTKLTGTGSLMATDGGNAIGSGTQFAVTQDGSGAGTLNVAGDFAGAVQVAGNAASVSLNDSSAATQLVITGLSAAPSANVTLTSAGAMQVDAAALSPVTYLTATAKGGDMMFLNSGTLHGGAPGILTGTLTLHASGALNSAADPLVVNAATTVANITASPAHVSGQTPPVEPESEPEPAPDALLRQATDVAGTLQAEIDTLIATAVRGAAGLLHTERRVFLGNVVPSAATAPVAFRGFAARLPRCVSEQQKGEPGCR